MSFTEAQCRDIDDETFKMFFGDSEDVEEPYNDEHQEYVINKFCMECPIMTLCYTKHRLEPYGAVGGRTANERRSF